MRLVSAVDAEGPARFLAESAGCSVTENVSGGSYPAVMDFRGAGRGAVILIADSGMLMGEVLQGSRGGGRITSLLWALHRGGAVLLLPRHVVEEVERDLPRRAKAGDDVELAYRRLRTLYLPRARVIDVPPDWGEGDPRIVAVAARHPVDLPAARLAVALGVCFLLSEDKDLCDPAGLGVGAWLQVAHAAANETEMETIYFGFSVPVTAVSETARVVSRRIAAASPAGKWAAAGVVVALGLVVLWLVRSGKATAVADRVRPVVREIGEIYGPPLLETIERHERGRTIFAESAVPPPDSTTLAERIARVMAFCGSPVLAEDIARRLGGPDNLRDRTRLVRAELLGCGAFVQVRRGRWMLGEPGGGPAAPLPLTEMIDYWERLHKNTRRADHNDRAPAADGQRRGLRVTARRG